MFRSLLLASAAMVSASAARAQADAPAADDGLLFSAPLDQDFDAVRAGGEARPLFLEDVALIADGAQGGGARAADSQILAWGAPGNLYAQRGTLSFFWRSHQPIGRRQFVIFRVGYPDHTSWDMTFLRLDWNGHGFDAFVTDANLARVRVSFDAPAPDKEKWTHFAIAWDETSGLALYVNGRPAARKTQKAVLDNGLYAFGPHSRIISGYQVQSAYDYQRGGDVDAVATFDHMLGDAEVLALSQGRSPSGRGAPVRDLAQPQWRDEWLMRYGFNRPGDAPPYLSAPSTRITSVRPTEVRDLKARFWRGNDGVRETTWPGVYNRSRLPGRRDYFILPDWNVYSEGGKTLTLSLPDRSWNRIEIQGAADGVLSAGTAGRESRIGTRPPGQERTSLQLAEPRTGGILRFENRFQETPIREIGLFMVEPGGAPAGATRLNYIVQAGAASDYPTLDELNAYVAGRFVADERQTVVALPAGAPRKPRPTAAPGRFMPLVHVLVPADFRAVSPGQPVSHFSYGWANMADGLDGIEINLPALRATVSDGGLIPLNIRVKDPLSPDRDLIDVNVSVKPGEPRKLFLDTRDRLLPGDRSLYIQIASASPDFAAESLDGTGISLVFKPRASALAEHVADREEQVRGALAQFVEEQPNNKLLPVYAQFERDVTDLLRADPDNRTGRAYWAEQNDEQPAPAFAQTPPIAGTPLWAQRQIEDLRLARHFVDWWIDHRQIPEGGFGGGLSDDSDLLHQWPPIALMGLEPERIRASQRATLDAIYRSGMITNGLNSYRADELHSYEEGINTIAQYALLNWGSPRAIEQLMATARRYGDLTEVNPAGHRHFVSNSFASDDMWREGPWQRQKGNNFLMFHPGILLVQWNGAPRARTPILQTLDGFLAHGKPAQGGVTLPSQIDWPTDGEVEPRGTSANTAGFGLGGSSSAFWAAYRWTGDRKYLAPLLVGAPTSLVALGPDVMTELDQRAAWGPLFEKAAGEPGNYRQSNTGGPGSGLAMARYAAWQASGDKRYLEQVYSAEIQSASQRMPMMTEGELWTDRVQIPSEILQRSRLGGVASRRGQTFPGNRVSWRFAGPDAAEQVALAFREASGSKLSLIAYNLTDKPVAAAMVGADVVPGRWSVRHGADADQDGRADAAEPRVIAFGPGEAAQLTLPPGQSVVEMTLSEPGQPSWTRPDVGIDPEDVRASPGRLKVTVHGLGAVASPGGQVIVQAPDGREIARARFAALAAPEDLQPKTVLAQVALARGTSASGLRVRLVLDGEPAEISRSNNEVTLP